MSEKLRLGPLPKAEVVRLTVALPARTKADLDRYAELYAAAYGEAVDPAALVPHMLATFMERDRAFRRAVQYSAGQKDSRAMTSAFSRTKEAAGDTSSSR